MEAGDQAKLRLLLRGGVVTLAAVVALVAWLATRGDGENGEGSGASTESSSRIVSRAELAETAVTLGQPVYWAGAVPGTELELEELAEGGVRVRYVPDGGEAGEGSPAALAIGSYPLADPEAALTAFAERAGSIVRRARDGSEVVSSEALPTSVYFVSADKTVQVEVYDPSSQRAMRLALSGRVRPVR
ncbi:MAG: hypothetical protein QOF13_118 [Solirubrobacterales bacterium]|jgi:hypothetical protein|nr:hypothetical protein [Solirubrobacterales bacterium]